MSNEQYPVVSSDDSGLVPPQSAPKSEWPKKIRTLTAAELDRLAIDMDGRFYWDGRPVSFVEPPKPPEPKATETKASEPVDLDALALLDRAARELSDPHGNATAPFPAPEPEPPPAAEPASTAAPADAPAAGNAEVQTVSASEAPSVAAVPQVAPVPMFDAPWRAPEKVRLRLSFWQSLALLLVIVGLLVGAVGIAVSGLVAAHEWGCRTGLVKQFCPAPPPTPQPPPRPDIPA